ncbi:MAG: ribosome assembly cofactor RimP [Flavobacteriales bacterium]|nr:ribosome assembly cofactor RimP [Flavobacteriales bacterium]
MIDKKTVIALAEERINELDKGLFIVDLAISSANDIKLFLDAEQSKVSIQDCVSVSRNIEHNLDREKEDFQLSVSSAGMDQPFKVHKQYVKNVGREVKVVLNEHGSQEGKLISVNENFIMLEQETKEKIEGRKKKEVIVNKYEIPFSNIKQTKLVISFK